MMIYIKILFKSPLENVPKQDGALEVNKAVFNSFMYVTDTTFNRRYKNTFPT